MKTKTKHCNMTSAGLIVSEGCTEEELVQVGINLGEIQRSMALCIGDWWNTLEKWKGGHARELCEENDINCASAATYGSVCRAVPIEERLPIGGKYSFGHYKAVASLSKEERRELLLLADAGGRFIEDWDEDFVYKTPWTVRQMQRAVAIRKDDITFTVTARDHVTITTSHFNNISKEITDDTELNSVYSKWTASSFLEPQRKNTLRHKKEMAVQKVIDIIRTLPEEIQDDLLSAIKDMVEVIGYDIVRKIIKKRGKLNERNG